MHDSGKRQKFSSGAVRDTAEDKPMLELISPYAEERLGTWLTKGSKKYKARNWELGLPFQRTFASLKRHVNKFNKGNMDEDHLAAIMCNAMFLIHYEEMIKIGALPADLDDMPKYEQRRKK